MWSNFSWICLQGPRLWEKTVLGGSGSLAAATTIPPNNVPGTPTNFSDTFTAVEYDQHGHEISSTTDTLNLSARGTSLPSGVVNNPKELSITSPTSGGEMRSNHPTISGTGSLPSQQGARLTVEVKLTMLMGRKRFSALPPSSIAGGRFQTTRRPWVRALTPSQRQNLQAPIPPPPLPMKLKASALGER